MEIFEKPWGREELIEHNSAYMVKRLIMYAGKRCSLQLHNLKCETIYVLQGKLRIYIGKTKEDIESKIYTSGETITIRPGVIHRMEAVEDAIYLEASTPELKDVVRIEDDYNRKVS
tara:strand:+ start:204 stop:551 length:348 start_codon:yes stop_codon:yes gene_type:complete